MNEGLLNRLCFVEFTLSVCLGMSVFSRAFEEPHELLTGEMLLTRSILSTARDLLPFVDRIVDGVGHNPLRLLCPTMPDWLTLHRPLSSSRNYQTYREERPRTFFTVRLI